MKKYLDFFLDSSLPLFSFPASLFLFFSLLSLPTNSSSQFFFFLFSSSSSFPYFSFFSLFLLFSLLLLSLLRAKPSEPFIEPSSSHRDHQTPPSTIDQADHHSPHLLVHRSHRRSPPPPPPSRPEPHDRSHLPFIKFPPNATTPTLPSSTAPIPRPPNNSRPSINANVRGFSLRPPPLPATIPYFLPFGLTSKPSSPPNPTVATPKRLLPSTVRSPQSPPHTLHHLTSSILPSREPHDCLHPPPSSSVESPMVEPYPPSMSNHQVEHLIPPSIHRPPVSIPCHADTSHLSSTATDQHPHPPRLPSLSSPPRRQCQERRPLPPTNSYNHYDDHNERLCHAISPWNRAMESSLHTAVPPMGLPPYSDQSSMR